MLPEKGTCRLEQVKSKGERNVKETKDQHHELVNHTILSIDYIAHPIFGGRGAAEAYVVGFVCGNVDA